MEKFVWIWNINNSTIYIHKKKKLRHRDVCNPKEQSKKTVCNPSFDADYDWDLVYGDWRTWEKKSKQIEEWEGEQWKDLIVLIGLSLKNLQLVDVENASVKFTQRFNNE